MPTGRAPSCKTQTTSCKVQPPRDPLRAPSKPVRAPVRNHSAPSCWRGSVVLRGGPARDVAESQGLLRVTGSRDLAPAEQRLG